jgi:CRP-like cAMP-binding protein
MSRKARENRKYADRLQGAEFLAGCSRRELRAMASLCTPIDVPAGRVLTRQGEFGRECFVVLEGHAVVERDGLIVGFVVDGSVIGEMALLGDGIRTATVTAATDMTLLVMSRSEFAAMRALGIASGARQRLDGIITERHALTERLIASRPANARHGRTPEPSLSS